MGLWWEVYFWVFGLWSIACVLAGPYIVTRWWDCNEDAPAAVLLLMTIGFLWPFLIPLGACYLVIGSYWQWTVDVAKRAREMDRLPPSQRGKRGDDAVLLCPAGKPKGE